MIMKSNEHRVDALSWPHQVASMGHRHFDDVSQTCLDLGTKYMQMPYGVISSIHRNVYRIDKVFGRPPGLEVDDEWSVEETPCFRVLAAECIFSCPDLLEDKGADFAIFAQKHGIRGFISAPIWVNQSVQGTLSFFSNEVQETVDPEIAQALELAAFGLSRFLEFEHFKNIRELMNIQLKEALEDVKALHGLLPICASCKKIRDVDGLWVKFEEYVAKHSLAQLSHGLCKPCVKDLYGFDPDEMDSEEEECSCGG
jgi:hypothetical protein